LRKTKTTHAAEPLSRKFLDEAFVWILADEKER
jgi:hypothetical protein